MQFTIKNELGVISIEGEVVKRIAGLAVMECCGVVGMAVKNLKDGVEQFLKIENLSKGVRLSSQENGMTVDLHIIVEYGTNISAIAETLMTNVKYRIQEYTGLPVRDVHIHVESVRADG